MTDRPIVIVPPTQAKVHHAFGDEIVVHLGGAETSGRYTSFVDIVPPGGGPPPHWHDDEDEWFFPLEGRMEFLLGEEWREVPLRTAIFAPKGSVHTFRNSGEEPLQVLIHTAPSGIELFFEKCAVEFAKPGPPDMAKIVEIGREHGIHFVG